MRKGNLNTAFKSEHALCRLLPFQFHGVLLYWFWDSRSWEMTSSVLTIEGTCQKCLVCLMPFGPCCRPKGGVFFALAASFSITARKSWFRLEGLRNPLEPSPGYAPDLTGFHAIRPIFLFLRSGCSGANLLFGPKVQAARLMIIGIGRWQIMNM